MKITYCNIKKEFPSMENTTYNRWFSIDKYWGGKLISISIKHHSIWFDFRKDISHDLSK